jgi:hypothetical protein
MLSNIKINTFLSIAFVTFFSLFTFVISTNDANAQPGTPECIDGTKIPAYYQPYNGPETDSFMVSPGCWVKYSYCYRCDCYNNDCINSGSVFYDFYICAIQFRGDCYNFNTGNTVTLPEWGTGEPGSGDVNGEYYVAVYPFNPVVYQSLYEGCTADLIKRINPWKNCDLNALTNIPPCESGMSPTLYRAGKPSCTSDFLFYWKDGVLWGGTFACNTQNLGYYCFNTYKACWKEEPIGSGNRYLDIIETGTGTPGTWVCPPIYQLPPNVVPYPAPNEQINCNAICGE